MIELAWETGCVDELEVATLEMDELELDEIGLERPGLYDVRPDEMRLYVG